MGIIDAMVPITNLAYRTSVYRVTATGPMNRRTIPPSFSRSRSRHKSLLDCRIPRLCVRATTAVAQPALASISWILEIIGKALSRRRSST
jgi:hypothetical protein